MQLNLTTSPNPVFIEQISVQPEDNQLETHIFLRNQELLKTSFFFDKNNELFINLLTSISALGKKSDEQRKTLVKVIQINFQLIIQLNEGTSNQLQEKFNLLKKELIKNENDLAEANGDILKNTLECNQLTANLAGFNKAKEESDRMIKELVLEIDTIQQQIKEEDSKRTNAALDLIPFYGLIDGIIKGSPIRGIPFYSQVNGLISLFSQSKENRERRLVDVNIESKKLEEEAQKVIERITKNLGMVSEIKDKIEKLQTIMALKDREIRQAGQNLTTVQNINFAIKQITSKYKFLEEDIDLRASMIDDGLLDDDVTSELLEEAKGIQQFAQNLIEISF